MNIEDLIVFDADKRRHYSAEQIIAALDGAASLRTQMPATYTTDTVSPTVYYTSTDTSGNVITSRRTSGVSHTQGFYLFEQDVSGGLTEFIAIWDEGNVNDFTSEWIVVDE